MERQNQAGNARARQRPLEALPATTAGITQMENLTPKQATGGCAFACHQAGTNNGDTAGNPCADGTAP
jgi:hypothetical protein